jgi:hypothetical protein
LPFGCGHKTDGATFNRFGLLNVVKSADGGGKCGSTNAVNGQMESFVRDPVEEFQNCRTYLTQNVRPV